MIKIKFSDKLYGRHFIVYPQEDVKKSASGLFALLPLALRAVDKLEALVRHRIEEVGGQRLSLPALTAANLWEKTGRMSEELLKVQDRTGRSFVLAPCGDMGGSESHEWQLPAPAGEDRVPTDGGSVSSVEHDKVNGKWQFTCQHGADECYGNKLQSCILKDRGLLDTDKMELVICLMTQANPDKSLDTRCAGGDQGDTLLASNGDKTDGVQRPLAFVPTVVVNERFDQAIQDEAVTNLKAVICRLAPTKPAVC
ncbi:hypothetical protein MSG28_014394 [Choristoneura fumiferana]|uniref:Uncharacterized protein n=1 Tax=Choristoneura fumiferana TaxID=7141 RepID=A0ACC0JR98_CHOFU|nr:hypothetical protein MSG28_014394 [Choristoneura fumiferana]